MDGSFGGSVSANGRFVAFTSSGHDLVPDDTNGREDVFVRDRDTDGDGVFDEPGSVKTVRVSLGPGDAQADHRSFCCGISAEGRFVLFRSDASNLVTPPVALFSGHAYVRDRDPDGNGIFDEPATGLTTLVSVSTGGARAEAGEGKGIGVPAMSANGRFVAFLTTTQAFPCNLEGADNLKDEYQAYRHDRDTDADGVMDEPDAIRTVIVSVNAVSQLYSTVDGRTLRSSAVGVPSLAADGRYVAFLSTSNGLVPGLVLPDDYKWRVFVRDMTAGQTSHVSVPVAGVSPDNTATRAAISGNGQHVAFGSYATNLVPGDTNGRCDVFVRDLAVQRTIRVSVASDGRQANGESDPEEGDLAISADGRFVTFGSLATNLAPGAANSTELQVYLHDRDADGDGIFDEPGAISTTLVSAAADGTPAESDAGVSSISPDGRYVVFSSWAENLMDINAVGQVYLYDRLGVLPPSGPSADRRYEAGGVGATRLYRAPYDVGDPVSAGNGAYHFRTPLLSLNGPMGVGFALLYRSDWLRDGHALPATFWWEPFARARIGVVLDGTTYASIWLPGGDLVSFRREGADWVLVGDVEPAGDTTYTANASPIRYALRETTDHAFLMDPTAEWVYVFRKLAPATDGEAVGRLAAVLDRNGNALTYTYSSADSALPSQVGDGLGRTLAFAYTTVAGQTFLERVTDHGGRQVAFAYEPAGADNGGVPTLRSVTDALNQTTSFLYAGKVGGATDLVTCRLFPRGNRPYQQAYGAQRLNGRDCPRVVAQADAYALGVTTLAYDAESNAVTVTQPGNLTSVYTHFGPHSQPKSLADPAGHVAQFTRNGDGQPTGIPDRRGNLLTRVDRDGRTWTFTYNSRGQVLSASTPAGGVTTYTYNDTDGTLASRQDSDTQATTFAYDEFKRPVTAAYPGGAVVRLTYDANGQVKSYTDERTGAWTYAYDGNGNLSQVTDPATKTGSLAYDLVDRLIRADDRLGKSTTYAYDALSRLISVTDPTGVGVTFGYDPRNWVSRVTLGASQWDYTHNDEGVVTGVKTPLRHQWSAEVDDLGFPSAATDPLGGKVQFGRDLLSRLTSVTDPLSRVTRFDYDSRGDLAAVTLPGVGRAAYAWDSAGRLVRVTDLNGKNWAFTHTPMGRLATRTDPLGRVWRQSYDPRGRLTATPTTAYTWDGANRLTGIGSARLEYNGLGQLVRRSHGAAVTRFHYQHAIGLAPIVAEQDDTTGQFLRYYVWTPDGRLLYLIEASAGNAVRFYHFDRTGSALALTDGASTTVTDAYAYDPYGRLLARTGASPQPFTFVGRYGVRREDAAPGLYHMRARYYDAFTQRFLSPEPVWPILDDPRQLDPYQYAANAPLTRIDPTGLSLPADDLWRWGGVEEAEEFVRTDPESGRVTAVWAGRSQTGPARWVDVIDVGGGVYLSKISGMPVRPSSGLSEEEWAEWERQQASRVAWEEARRHITVREVPTPQSGSTAASPALTASASAAWTGFLGSTPGAGTPTRDWWSPPVKCAEQFTGRSETTGKAIAHVLRFQGPGAGAGPGRKAAAPDPTTASRLPGIPLPVGSNPGEEDPRFTTMKIGGRVVKVSNWRGRPCFVASAKAWPRLPFSSPTTLPVGWCRSAAVVGPWTTPTTMPAVCSGETSRAARPLPLQDDAREIPALVTDAFVFVVQGSPFEQTCWFKSPR